MRIRVDKSDFLYKQLYHSLIKKIAAGEYPNGSRLPSESLLQAKYQVSSITVKKSLELLSEEGYICRIPGRGTFVRDQIPGTKQPPLKIGAVLEHVSTPFGLEMMYRMDLAAEKAGFRFLFRFSYGDQKKEMSEIAFLIREGVSGLIIMPSHGYHYNTEILKLVVNKFPLVLVDKRLDGIPVPSVRTDNFGASALLVRHLIGNGCKNISFVTYQKSGATSLEEREEGFFGQLKKLHASAVEECEIPALHDSDMIGNASEKDTIEFIRDYLLKTKNILDGVICMEYGIIPPFLLAAKAADVRIGNRPGQLKVCCFDEDYLAPAGFYLTHVKQDERKIAEKSVSILTAQINGEKNIAEDYKIPAVFHQGFTT